MKNVLLVCGCMCSLAAAVVFWYAHPQHVLATRGEAVRYLNVPGMQPPIARYSQVVIVPASEEIVFLSGAAGEGPSGKMSDDVVEQTRQTMENIKKMLGVAGSDFSHVVKMNIFLIDFDHMPELRKVRDAYLDPKRAPAMTTVKVQELVEPGMKVEIEVTGVRSSQPEA